MPNQPHGPSAGTARRSAILEPLFTHHRRELRRQAARHVARPADVDDALQEACVAFLRLYEGPPGLDALRWMMLVVKRCAWRLGEESRRHEALAELTPADASDPAEGAVVDPLAEADADPAVLQERRAHDADLHAQLAALKSDERAALLLFGAGYSYAEIARGRGWSATKVNRCIAEGRAALPAYRG